MLGKTNLINSGCNLYHVLKFLRRKKENKKQGRGSKYFRHPRLTDAVDIIQRTYLAVFYKKDKEGNKSSQTSHQVKETILV